MGQSFSRAGPPHDGARKEFEPAPPRPAMNARRPLATDAPAAPAALSPPGLVITEAAMCAYCFDSIIAHFNGVRAATVPPSFPNGSQCVPQSPDFTWQLHRG
jgi:hypothetical protein